MGLQRTRTVKNKHAANKSGIQNSKASRQPQTDGFVKAKSTKKATKTKQIPASSVAELLKKRKQKKTYTEEQLGIPKLNAIRPAGVVKPSGKKKGKVFVDDAESMRTILAIVQAEKEGQIESKIMKARQMEEIREARRIEAEKKEEEKNAKLEDVKDSLRKKRKRKETHETEESVKELTSMGSRAAKPKPKKKVTFA